MCSSAMWNVAQPLCIHGKWGSCVWFTYFLSVQMNDGPLCKCSAKARRTGIRHSIYPGEEVWHAVNKSHFSNLAQRAKYIILLCLNVFSAQWPFSILIKRQQGALQMLGKRSRGKRRAVFFFFLLSSLFMMFRCSCPCFCPCCCQATLSPARNIQVAHPRAPPSVR